MPYDFNDAMIDATNFAHGLADRLETDFRKEFNLGDEPFTSLEARLIEQIQDHMIETWATILFRTSKYMVTKK